MVATEVSAIPQGVLKLGWSPCIPRVQALLIKEAGFRLSPGRGHNLLPRAIPGGGLSCARGMSVLVLRGASEQLTTASTSIGIIAIHRQYPLGVVDSKR